MSVFKEDIFKGKVALITGGSRGGMLFETAKQILAHGARGVALVARNYVKLQEAAKLLEEETGGNVIGIKGNVRSEESCEDIVDKCLEAFGSIDFLINGAAGNFLV
jgi:peroxisomal 2,4-dienoyl-CoA reductase